MDFKDKSKFTWGDIGLLGCAQPDDKTVEVFLDCTHTPARRLEYQSQSEADLAADQVRRIVGKLRGTALK